MDQGQGVEASGGGDVRGCRQDVLLSAGDKGNGVEAWCLTVILKSASGGGGMGLTVTYGSASGDGGLKSCTVICRSTSGGGGLKSCTVIRESTSGGG